MDNQLLESIREHNERLKKLKETANQMKAKVEYSEKEFNRLSAELSAEMGMQITKENVEQVHSNLVAQITECINNGKQVFDRIEAQMNGVEAVSNQQTNGVVSQQPYINPMSGLTPSGYTGAEQQPQMQAQQQAPYMGAPMQQQPMQQQQMFDGQPVMGLGNFGNAPGFGQMTGEIPII